MDVLTAKRDVEFMRDFRANVFRLWEMEDSVEISRTAWMSRPGPGGAQEARQRAAEHAYDDYQDVRQSVATAVTKANRLAAQHGIPNECISYPPTAVDGPAIPIRTFEAILGDTSYGGINRQTIQDNINRTLGACEDHYNEVWRKAVNPYHWIKGMLILFLRTPFMIISATGFNVEKIEDHLIGKSFKLVFVLGVAYGLLRLGFSTSEIAQGLRF